MLTYEQDLHDNCGDMQCAYDEWEGTDWYESNFRTVCIRRCGGRVHIAGVFKAAAFAAISTAPSAFDALHVTAAGTI